MTKLWLGWISIALIANFAQADTPAAAPTPPPQPPPTLSPAENRAHFAQWAALKTPVEGPVQPIGGYDAGCLIGAVKIDADAPGYAVMRPSRNRYYGHPDMDVYLHALAEKLQSQKMPLLLIGDVGPPQGGPMLGGHASHQIGLDTDLWLTMGRKRPSLKERETWSAPSFVKGRKKLKKSWSSKQTDLIVAAASFDAVNRIFVSPAIKKYLCAKFPTANWLYKIRAWWGHTEHIHVRLNCPVGSSTCVSQTALNPAENDCGEKLDWWYSKEADEELAKLAKAGERQFPILPGACEKLVAP